MKRKKRKGVYDKDDRWYRSTVEDDETIKLIMESPSFQPPNH